MRTAVIIKIRDDRNEDLDLEEEEENTLLEQMVDLFTLPRVGEEIHIGDGTEPDWLTNRWCESAIVIDVCHVLFQDSIQYLGNVIIIAIAKHIHETRRL